VRALATPFTPPSLSRRTSLDNQPGARPYLLPSSNSRPPASINCLETQSFQRKPSWERELLREGESLPLNQHRPLANRGSFSALLTFPSFQTLQTCMREHVFQLFRTKCSSTKTGVAL
jgi:hypothetical protein